MTRRRLLLSLFAALLLCSLLLCRIERQARGVWRLTVPAFSVTALRDTRLGPVLWVYWWGEFRGQWKGDQWYPAEPTPYPTNTPYPTPTRQTPLQEV